MRSCRTKITSRSDGMTSAFRYPSVVYQNEAEDVRSPNLPPKVELSLASRSLHPPPPSPTMPPPSQHPSEHYTHLTTALSPLIPTILDLDILPSSYPPHIHLAPNALALPKPLLISLFVIARHIFFAHLAAPSEDSHDAALKATLVILFWEPNHATAANFRKRYLRGLLLRGSDDDDIGEDEIQDAVRRELCFTASLVTSPLIRHAKSSTLWSHRLWVLKTFPISNTSPFHSSNAQSQPQIPLVGFWREELSIIMRAGERHPRNYYAWNYARQLFATLSEREEGSKAEMARASVEVVKKWCLAHPRDVSGWAFLAFLLGRVDGVGEKERGRVVQDTRAFVRKYKWRGESVEWFLKVVG
jgi:hypothetical protein